MRRILVFTALASCLLTGFTALSAQEEESQQTYEAPKPGPEHEFLAKGAGCWDVEFFFSPMPGMEPQKTTGKSWNRRDLGGFWMIGDVRGKMMGADYVGHSIQGYDPYRKKCVFLGLDNLGDYYVLLEGPLDIEAGKWVGHGTMTAGGQEMEIIHTTEFVSEDEQKAHLVVKGKMGEKEFEFTPMKMNLHRAEGPDTEPASEKKPVEAPGPKPGPKHELLRKLAGTWDAKMEMMGQTSKGTMTWSLGHGGLWLTIDFEGRIMNESFKGHGFLGYDGNKKKYVGAWVDSYSPALMLTEGELEDGILVERTEGYDPMTGKESRGKNTTRFIDENTIEWKMFDTDEEGNDSLMLKITYTRREKK